MITGEKIVQFHPGYAHNFFPSNIMAELDKDWKENGAVVEKVTTFPCDAVVCGAYIRLFVLPDDAKWSAEPSSIISGADMHINKISF